ncbi:MAG: putative Coenzyme F420-dependent N(10)-methylenetetrahydromethanopterin reductase [Frankiales bacterium]|nr:putative Coenzyme F420-dependent N(10)-methylenetetrahydromethanopterin reductase [Frankiales bacterium]
MPTAPVLAPELGAYVLPGRASSPKLAVEQAVAGEQVGLGSVYLSERLGTKDLGTVGGAIAQATERVTITAAATHMQSRHPLALASLAITLQALSDERFVLGIGRSIPQVWKAHGLPPATNAVLVDGLGILRRLWAGEEVSYDGPLGTFPSLYLKDRPDVAPPPVLLTAIGPQALKLAGEHFDGVLLHAFLTAEGHRRSADAVRKAASDAGRDPGAVRLYGMVVVAADLPQDEVDLRVRARLVTYLNAPKLGESLVQANGWDARVLEAVAAHPLIAALEGRTADGALDGEQLVEVSRVIPDEWFDEGAAVGTHEQCAAVLRSLQAAGADEMIVHGSSPELLGPTVRAFAATAPGA